MDLLTRVTDNKRSEKQARSGKKTRQRNRSSKYLVTVPVKRLDRGVCATLSLFHPNFNRLYICGEISPTTVSSGI